ncbi:unnamed protein product [Miscanthus lutarioriparius]|uniref:Uncharacterized protein n=1 Tax=Miscanthus lutarioriparius TaxID=422564 RepID=A0A811MHS7_9POAL|nr:unnamed protein product [Miscanthus lutarioriparius]
MAAAALTPVGTGGGPVREGSRSREEAQEGAGTEAAGLLRLAAAGAAAVQEGAGTEATAGAKRDLPVARKAPLQRFMEKRKVRVAARTEPYRRPDASDACPGHLKLAL